ncbi:hypothetical protein QE152_g33336 [Popillia japonica]|uniref:Uncharacterized protein n=1 Tax=Popillia japonica TaxID=7064 RepID=A0AAW1IXU4_POPJA
MVPVKFVIQEEANKANPCFLSKKLEKLESNTESVTPILFEKIVAETKERVQRDNNVIVYGLNENQDDGTVASCIINAIASAENYADRIVHTMRLGRLQGAKHRALRIVFNNPFTVKDVLRNKHNLKSQELYRSVFIRRDETSNQRELLNKCRKELNERKKSGEQNLGIRNINRLEKLESNTESVTPILFEKIVAETKERVQRDNNVIVYGLNENQDDGTVASCIINAIASAENYADRIVHTMRLGRLQGAKHRALRIVFNNPFTVKDVLRNKHNLKSQELYRSVFIRRDETSNQRELLNKCRKELNERKKSGEQNLGIRNIKGVPTVAKNLGSSVNLGIRNIKGVPTVAVNGRRSQRCDVGAPADVEFQRQKNA